MNPKVSVIIPCYNAEKFIGECLDSIINQTLTDIEIICVDDGSTDESLSILERYASVDSRVKVMHQKNQGTGTARNTGLQVAKGEYLSILDSDDFFDLAMLEACTKKMDQEQSDILVYAARQYDQQTGIISDMPWSLRTDYCPGDWPFAPYEMSKYIFNAFQNWPWNKMFRHSFIKSNGLRFQEIPRTNDMSFVCMALVLANKISIINCSYANYRVNTGTSLQQTNDKAPLSFWWAYKETKRLLIAAGKYILYEQSFLNWVIDGTLYNLRSVNSDMAHLSIISIIRNSAEDDFGFLKKPIDYYFDKNLLMDYCLINSHESKSVQYIRELVDRKNEELRNLDRGISELRNEIRINQAELQATRTELQATRVELQATQAELQAVVNSKAFKLGTAIAKPWRWFRDSFTKN